jgi:hypothetical protein
MRLKPVPVSSRKPLSLFLEYRHSMKPLFIPLKAEFYERFKSGEKRSELRLYGPRWNERTCTPGRDVILSCGYGKAKRLTGKIALFLKRDARTFGSTYQEDVLKVYGSLDLPIAEIRIDIFTG